MPIRGLTDTYTPGAGLPLVGRLYKGDVKPDEKRPGKDLDYFRVEFGPQYAGLRELWNSLYGQHPVEFQPVYFAGHTAAETFSTWQEEWGSAGLKVRCDGEKQVLWYDDAARKFQHDRLPCRQPQCRCKPTGRLHLLLPEFIELSGVLGYMTLTTHSLYDILAVDRYLKDIERLQTIQGNTLAGVPFVLGRAKREVSVTTKDKQGAPKRIKQAKNLLYIGILPGMTRNLLPAFGAGSESGGEALRQLPPPSTDEVRAALGNGGSRRVGPEILEESDESEPEPRWNEIAEARLGFLVWCKGKLGLDEPDVIEALAVAESVPNNGAYAVADFMGDKVAAMAAALAYKAGYDADEIHAMVAKMPKTYFQSLVDAALAIVKAAEF